MPENGDGNYAPSPSGEGPAMTDLTVGISDPVTWGEPEQVNPKNILVEGDRLPVDEDIDAGCSPETGRQWGRPWVRGCLLGVKIQTRAAIPARLTSFTSPSTLRSRP